MSLGTSSYSVKRALSSERARAPRHNGTRQRPARTHRPTATFTASDSATELNRLTYVL